MQLSKERVIACVEDGRSVIQTQDDDAEIYSVVIVSKEEWAYWLSITDLDASAEYEQLLNFNQAA
ncbi:MAG: hypothetical protein V7785_22055 [Bermanella sp.]